MSSLQKYWSRLAVTGRITATPPGHYGYKVGGRYPQYSARKPAGCPVPVEFCLNCTEPDCTYEEKETKRRKKRCR
jgi:hypothetical protein